MAGHNKIKMTDLFVLYQDLGFNDAETFIQSGNVIFSYSSDISVRDISLRIEAAIHQKYNYSSCYDKDDCRDEKTDFC
jgi:uncharacterized protein (DUF1697 family)